MSTATANKIKQFRALQQICMDRMSDLYAVATSAKINSENLAHFKARASHLESLYKDFEDTNAALIPLLITIDAYNNEDHKDITKSFYEDYYRTRSIYEQLFESPQNLSSTSASQSHSNVRLPKIELVKFDGNLRQWKTFIDMFKSLVHENDNLRNIEKFNYLISSLSGPPLALVKCNPVSETNYTVAYESLLQRYENKRLLATAHYLALENAPKISDNNATSHNLQKLVDTYTENIAALKNLEFPTSEWSFLLLNMLLRRLDSNTVSRFEINYGSNEVPSFDSLKNFVLEQCSALNRAADYSQKKSQNLVEAKGRPSQYIPPNGSHKRTSFHTQVKDVLCLFCNGNHLIYKCPTFLELSPSERYNIVKSRKWCLNCLGSRHSVKNCSSRSRCLKCSQSHHTLLHFRGRSLSPTYQNQTHPIVQENSSIISAPGCNDRSPPLAGGSLPHSLQPAPSTSTYHCFSKTKPIVLLSTALIEVQDGYGTYQKIRALLDSGSQINIISERCYKRLGLRPETISLSIQGINELYSHSSKAVSLHIRPCDNPKPLLNLNAVIMKKVSSCMPSQNIGHHSWPHISNLKLADPQYHVPSEVDILLGADIFSLIFETGRIVGNPNEPVALNTIFGWILMGTVHSPSTPLVNSLHCSNVTSIDTTLRKFWEIEEIPKSHPVSPDDELCEKMYLSSLSRDESGRYCVGLPFRYSNPIFFDSREMAIKRFFSLERRLRFNPALYTQYCEVIQDYLDQGHMSMIDTPFDTPQSYYIPHHCVVRHDSSSTKLRVVFDASAKDADGVSLNDSLLPGPKLQNDLTTILVKFRIHPVALMMDIRQMYRQIRVLEKHKDYQRILWRFSPDKPIQEYVLNTVSFGISSAPFLAIRTLMHLAEEEKSNYPLASEVLRNDSYVDDIVTSCRSLDEAEILKSQLISLLQQGRFELHKWNSNYPTLLSSNSCADSMSLDLECNTVVKVLGLQWNSTIDKFTFSLSSLQSLCTKRTILSQLARIFDPLGFLSPLTLFAKRLMQRLWSIGIGWDEPPPQDIADAWNQLKSELSLISLVTIPRVLFSPSLLDCSLHGFSDASEKGYAAVIYSRFKWDGRIHIHIVCAKSKVAPLKTISIPRLELCAAALLADLFSFILNAFQDKISFTNIYAWTDSLTTLSWIRSSPHKWKTFVANRVTFIQERLSPNVWNFVPTHENPADCASRGILPGQLIKHPLWWAGPPWLKEHIPPLSPSTFSNDDPQVLLEERNITLLAQKYINILDPLFQKFSSFSKIQRVVAYVHRFISNCRLSPTNRKLSHINSIELHQALLSIVKHVQTQTFHIEISSLVKGKPLSKSLRKLSPFLDKNNLLRVGGRLSHSTLSYDKRYPLLLPSHHIVTFLIIEETHKQYLHPGYQTLHFLLLQKFWILSAKRVIRKIISKCLTCWKQNPSSNQPPMGDLPPSRLSKSKPFSCVGIDFGGPFVISLGKFRGTKTTKAYICLFVCFVTKALHLELATDLSTDTFLAALRRFISRRGRVSTIYSDNATNFVGASRILLTLTKNAAEQESIEWKFIPPSTPHFGGLWEAGIKSVKSHLSRVIGNQILTYEELNTVLTQIEAVLNSRPLYPTSSDPNDLSVLTPGHFLTMEPLNSVPDEDLCSIKMNRLSRWQMVQRLYQDFWSRWSKEYLHTLFQRGKWSEPCANIQVNSMVLLKNANLPPLRWQLGRVVDIHPGEDGIVRVVTVRTTQGLLKRPVVKLCPLPLSSSP